MALAVHRRFGLRDAPRLKPRARGRDLLPSLHTRTVDLHGLVEALRLPLPEVGVVQRQVLWHRLVDSTRDAHTARLGQLLNPLGKNDPRPGDRIVGNHYFAETDADAQSRLQVVFKPGVGLSVLYLECEPGRDRVRRPSELCHQRIPA